MQFDVCFFWVHYFAPRCTKFFFVRKRLLFRTSICAFSIPLHLVCIDGDFTFQLSHSYLLLCFASSN